jgi:hypothetical protein
MAPQIGQVDAIALILVGASGVMLSLGVVLLAGWLPLSRLPPLSQREPARALVLLALLEMAALCFLVALFAVARLGWAWAVVALGLGLLAGPLVFQAAPSGLRNRPLGLVVFIGACALWGGLLLRATPE